MKLKFSIAILMLLGLVACSEYNKIAKDPDPIKRYDAAVQYYEDGKCYKAIGLLEDLLPVVRGTSRSENVYYYYAKAHYCEKDYILSGFYFKQFVKTFPQSQYSEECAFLAAMCSYYESPTSSLDQTETNDALNEMQVFLDAYPNTTKRDSINKMMDKLNKKLEIKEYENAQLYQKTLNYKSAAIAYQNFLKKYPATDKREEVMFAIIESNYLLAINSIERKKEERLKDTIKSYDNFASIFPESSYKKDAERYVDLVKKELEVLKAQN